MITLRIFGTPVKVKGIVLVYLVTLWAGLSWWGASRHPGRKFMRASLIGLGSTVLLMLVDFGHALAHIFSARYAKAPMDEILISEGMPRTLYRNNDVSPDVHRLRALGGPLYNLIGLIVSAVIYRAGSSKPIIRELSALSAIGHGLLFMMSLAPLPVVDGGTILKWTLVANGRAEAEADQIVQRIDWGMGIGLGILGLGFLALQIWIVGAVLVSIGLVIIGIAAGKIR